MFKLFKSLKKNNRGEVATMLTLISFLLITAGTILGSYIAQRETKTVGKAAGYHWNECQIGVCNASFDGRTDDNGWCQAAGVRCQRYKGKVCQLPDPWCDTPNQGAASACTGVNQKGFNNNQTCSTANYTPGNGTCEPPNENWETNLDCPWTLPGTGGGAQPPAGSNQTQCQNEGGFCSQSTDACNNTQGHAPDPTQPKDCSGSLPVCCKPWSTPTLTLTPTPTTPVTAGTISVTVNITNEPNQGNTLQKIYIVGQTQPPKMKSIIMDITAQIFSNQNSYTITQYNDSSPLINGDLIYFALWVQYDRAGSHKEESFPPGFNSQNITNGIPVTVPRTGLNLTAHVGAEGQSSIQLPPNALQFGFTAPEYKKVIDGYISGAYSALQISEWVSRATNTPGIKIKFCDPMKGECNIPF